VISELVSWWLARMGEMTPSLLVDAAGVGRAARVAIEVDQDLTPRAWLLRGGTRQPLSLGAAARLPSTTPVMLRVPEAAVLEKPHVLPSASHADLEAMLRHELPRITPFDIDAVYWDWRARPKPNDRSKLDVVLTIVPKVTIAAALDSLERAGIRPKLLEVASDRLLWLDNADRSRRHRQFKALIWANAALAGIAIVLPFLLQEYQLYQTDSAIDALRPAVAQVEAIRHRINSPAAAEDILQREALQTGNIPAVLATLTDLLPDDAYLTDFSLRQRQIVIAGRSSAASNLIPILAADPAFKNAAFDSPVTRPIGSNADLFSIRAEVAR
jgi:general secretion pathway protein L